MPTAAASKFHEWLDAVSRGDRMRQQFLERNGSSLPRSNLFGRLTGPGGGYDLRVTEEDTETRFVGIVQDRAEGFCFRIETNVDPHEPCGITHAAVHAVPPPPGCRPTRLSEPDAVAAFEKHLAEESAAERFSGVVLIAKRDKTILSGAYGLADRERGVPNTVNTIFTTASMGKIFTGVALLQLVQNGKLDVSKPLGHYVPEWPNKKVADRVTIYHLVTHTSGLTDFALLPQYAADRAKCDTIEDYVPIFGHHDYEWEPGTDWAYDNYGYQLLGLVVQRVTGEEFFQYVKEHVFDVAEMATAHYGPEETFENHALYYLKDDRGWRLMDMYRGRIGLGGGAGGAHLSVEDIKRFANALLDHRLLDAKHTELMMTGQVRAEIRSNYYSYGCQVYEVDSVRWFGHHGGGGALNAGHRIYPNSGYVVVAFANIAPPAAVHMVTYAGDRLPA